ncbi:cytochrome C biogenesis protein [Halobacteriales archaeon SW_5_70_135]|nr:MAG: cytochrome C biogenesis protein [Halobacteriales archaeon SW_5_70_135]
MTDSPQATVAALALFASLADSLVTAGPPVWPLQVPGVADLPVDPRVALAFSAGVATFFAPCAYPLLPGYVAYFLGSEATDETPPLRARLRRAAVVAVVTSAGFFLVYAVLAGAVAALGASALPLERISVLELLVGTGLILLGTAMALGRVGMGQLHVALPERRRSVGGYFAFGVVYAAAAAGCAAPVFVGVAGFAVSGAPPALAAAMFVAYALGTVLLMFLVTGLAAVGRDSVLRTVSRRSGLLSRVAGLVLATAGVVQVYLFLFRFDGLELLGLA